ncbi:hypothetical protein SAMN05216489_01877 [Streptomyces sp. 3213]|uniref:hypothetical protein n=1 Tax=Streptomyces sp. 3213.3 TaxID=1855348 RepID=UPI00089C2EC6|nr:hypothetical protein [Streptomyces sp. 3213.3]SEC88502.1 hypothetical protein SAMN05216489_01877 [Streptomyces sp. 3213] [Streptomyces sp. 3213.3]
MDDVLSVESFLAGARRFAHLAMAAHGRSDHELFALHGGVAVERLVKAALVAKSPALLLEMRGKVDALFHLTGVKPSAGRVHTVGANESISRLRKLGVLPEDTDLDDLIELRNGVAHSTQGDEGRELLPALARTVEIVLTDLGRDLAAFWGCWTETVRLALDESRTELERDVQVRIQQARNIFADRFDGLPDDFAKRFRNDQIKPLGFTLMFVDHLLRAEGAVKCPACGNQAAVAMLGRTDGGGSVKFVVDEVGCPMCQLTLVSSEEFDVADLDLRGFRTLRLFGHRLNRLLDERQKSVGRVTDFADHT